jgi:hypothetical protein
MLLASLLVFQPAVQKEVKGVTRISASQVGAAVFIWMSVFGLLNGASRTVPVTGLAR